MAQSARPTTNEGINEPRSPVSAGETAEALVAPNVVSVMDNGAQDALAEQAPLATPTATIPIAKAQGPTAPEVAPATEPVAVSAAVPPIGEVSIEDIVKLMQAQWPREATLPSEAQPASADPLIKALLESAEQLIQADRGREARAAQLTPAPEAKATPAPAEPPLPAAPVGAPTGMTRNMEAQLKKLGYTDEQLEQMTPGDAWEILQGPPPLPGAVSIHRVSSEALHSPSPIPPATAPTSRGAESPADGTAVARLHFYVRQFRKSLRWGQDEYGASHSAQVEVRRSFGPLPARDVEDEALVEEDPWADYSDEQLAELVEELGLVPSVSDILNSPDFERIVNYEPTREDHIATLSAARKYSKPWITEGRPTQPLIDALIAVVTRRVRREGAPRDEALHAAEVAVEALALNQDPARLDEMGITSAEHSPAGSSESSARDPWSGFSVEDIARLLDDDELAWPLGKAILESPDCDRIVTEGPTRAELICILRTCCELMWSRYWGRAPGSSGR